MYQSKCVSVEQVCLSMYQSKCVGTPRVPLKNAMMLAVCLGCACV